MSNFEPSIFTLAGTPKLTRMMLELVLQGAVEPLRAALAATKPTTRFAWLWEPYSNIQSKAQLAAFKVLLDDPRTVMDAATICSTLYFTPHGIRDVILSHPRAKRWAYGSLDRETVLQEYAAALYKRSPYITMNIGIEHRAVMAIQSIEIWRNKVLRPKQRRALAFALYPFLVAWSRDFLERYYEPGGKGYEKGKTRFEQGAQTLAVTA